MLAGKLWTQNVQKGHSRNCSLSQEEWWVHDLLPVFQSPNPKLRKRFRADARARSP